MAAQFRVEFFNFTNHTNLANPYGGVVNSALGNDPSVTGGFGCGCATPDIVNGNPILGSGDFPRDAARPKAHILRFGANV